MKKTRIVTFINGSGYTTARNTRNYNRDAWIVELYLLKQRGFFPADSFTIPARTPRRFGWSVFYRAWCAWAISAYGI